MSQQLPETKIVVSSQDSMACPFQTYPSLFLSREALLSIARKQFLELPCPCPVALRPVEVLTAVIRKAADLHHHSYFENYSSLNAQSEEKWALVQKSFVGVAHFSVVLMKI